jgi:hypothetical protein
MLQSIISYLQVKLQALNIATVYGLCELVYNTEREITQPAIYDGSGQYMPLDFDNNAGLMYFRKISVSNSFIESVLGDDGIQRTYTLKLVAFVPKSVYNTDNNYIDDKLANNISLIIDNDSDVILGQSLAAENISISTLSYDTNRRNVLLGEGLEGNIPFEYVLLSLDFSVTVVGSQDCFEIYGCNDVPIDYLELLRDAICETTCLDATVTATNSDSTVIGTATVASGGTGNIHIANSVISNTQGVIDSLPATTPLTIVDSVITLRNSVSTLSTTNVPATTNLTLTAPNSTTNVTDQNGTPLGQVTGISGATNTQQVTVPSCPTLQQIVDANTSANIATAINSAIDTTKPEGVFTGIIPNVDNATVEAGLSLSQRSELSRVAGFKIGIPVIYGANDIGTNNPGRGTDFFTLTYNNPNGNTNRFELLGTNVVIDWGRGLYWTRFLQSPAGIAWQPHNDNSAVLTLEGLTGWRLPSVEELGSIMDKFSLNPLNHAPWNIRSGTTSGAAAGTNIATGETNPANTAQYRRYRFLGNNQDIDIQYSGANKVTTGAVALYCKNM